MSTFWDKIAQGQSPTHEDWTELLLEAHQEAPSMTPQAFASYKAENGLTSYEFLADQVSPLNADITVVDLACGDGYLMPFVLPKLGPRANLIGVDMSESELAAARKKVSDPRVSFFNAHAEGLPLEPQSADVVLCHMAFMLMLPVEPVVAELAQVLKPGGLFAAITSDPKGISGFYAEIQKLVREFVDPRYPKIKEARAGDPRVFDQEGLSQLFRPESGFDKPVELGSFQLQVVTEPAGVWEFMKNMYFIGMLPPAEKQKLGGMMIELALRKAGRDGKARFGFPMRGFSVRKGAL